jgi:hypothetical protein
MPATTARARPDWPASLRKRLKVQPVGATKSVPPSESPSRIRIVIIARPAVHDQHAIVRRRHRRAGEFAPRRKVAVVRQHDARIEEKERLPQHGAASPSRTRITGAFGGPAKIAVLFAAVAPPPVKVAWKATSPSLLITGALKAVKVAPMIPGTGSPTLATMRGPTGTPAWLR